MSLTLTEISQQQQQQQKTNEENNKSLFFFTATKKTSVTCPCDLFFLSNVQYVYITDTDF